MKSFPRFLPLLALPAAFSLPSVHGEDLEFRPRTVIPRSFPAIESPKIVSVKEAESDDWVKADELVLGVVVNGKARAYPINTLTGPRREIINDDLGERSIAATW